MFLPVIIVFVGFAMLVGFVIVVAKAAGSDIEYVGGMTLRVLWVITFLLFASAMLARILGIE